MAELLAQLPGDALLPVAWIRAQLERDCGEPAAGETLLTTAEVAERLHRSRSTVRGWLEAGDFAGAFKLNGRDWRVPIVSLDAFLAPQRPQPSAQDAPGATIVPPIDTRTPVDLSGWRAHLTRKA